MASLKPETKARRVFKSREEKRKAVRKFNSFDDRKAAWEKAGEKFTDEARAALEARVAEAEADLNYKEAAPVADVNEYERLLSELEASATPEAEESDDEGAEYAENDEVAA